MLIINKIGIYPERAEAIIKLLNMFIFRDIRDKETD
jgi:hypothetical protein